MEHSRTCLLYEAGELGAAETAAFERHLASCAECRELLASALEARELAPLLQEDAPERVVAAVLGRGPSSRPLPTPPRPASRAWWGPPVPSLAGALAFACLALVMLWFGSLKQTPQWDAGIETALEELDEELLELETERYAALWDFPDLDSEMDEFEEYSDSVDKTLAGGVL